jgi:hypothetical protein
MYFLLLEVQWRIGYVPSNAMSTARLLSVQYPEYEAFEEAFKAVRDQFDPVEDDPSRMVNARQAHERTRAINEVAKGSARGKMAANERWRKERERKELDAGALQAQSTGNASTMQNKSKSKNTTTPFVSKDTTTDDVEKWNDVLAPLVRQAGGEPQVGNWLKWCKRQLTHGVPLETLEDWIGGMVSLRDRGSLEYIPKGQPFKPAAIERLPIGERDQLRKGA